ncbi:MAG: UvrD/REP helicase [Myxococcales bacterium]|nr:UvrD/REP helicase [Myxococcales bacterium]
MTPLERIARFSTDLAVQAGAGTGKTHALVTLYLHLVGGVTASARRVAPPRIAVVTFTEKAAGELKERIRARLGAVTKASDVDGEVERCEPTLVSAARALDVALPDAKAWAEALASLGAAPIGTFHSFCANLLRRHAARAALDPDYKLLDDDAASLATQAAERAVLDALTAGDGDVEELVAQFNFRANGRARGLVELLVELRGRRAEEGRDAAGLDANYALEAMKQAAAIAEARFDEIARRLPGLARELSPKSTSAPRARELCDALATFDVRRAEDVSQFVRALKKISGNAVKDWKPLVDEAARGLSDARASLKAAPLASALARLVAAVETSYRAQKRRAGVVDFTDLLTMARDLLRDDAEVRASVRSRFDAILVDEFQDTNPVQAELVRLLGGRQPDDESARLFVVGDRKQSIYEFRGADVGVFAQAAAQLVEAGGREELLGQSRRSAPGVLSLCNALFARALHGYEPARDDLSAFRQEAPSPSGAELLAVAPGPSADCRLREARAVARRIAQLRAGGRRLGDMAILLRRFTHLTDYLDALRAAGLPYFVVRGRGFFAAQEVRDLASALTVIDDPDDLLALVALLRSPIVGVSDETLARLALAGMLRTRVLLDASTALPDSLTRAEAEGLDRFRTRFRELRLTADRLGPAACAQAIVDDGDLVAVLASTPDGEQRVANLLRLVEKAREFEDRGGDLRAFANYLRRAAAPGGEAQAAEAQVADERDDVVRVMTVHQAKGLEFPVVFVPACGSLERNDNAPILYDATEGLGLKLRDEHLPAERMHTAASRRVAQARQRRQAAESMRVFYVAATRARDLVVFSGELMRAHQPSWRAQLDAVVTDERTRAAVESAVASTGAPTLLRVIDGDTLPAPLVAVAESTAEPVDELQARGRLQSIIARPAPRPGNVTVAVTQLADFQLCARRYQQFHALGLQEHPASSRAPSPDVVVDVDDGAPPLDPLRRGTLAHKLLERMSFASDGADLAVLDQLLVSDGYDVRDAAVAEVRAHVAAFLGTRFARELAGVAVRRELPFLLSVPYSGGVLYLRGQMDLVVLTSDGVTVVDYKHARLGDPEDYRFQLEAYALAARRLYPAAPSVRTGLAFLKEADATPAIREAGSSVPFEAELAALGSSLAAARAADQWPQEALPICHRLRCGFIYRCYPDER